MIGILYYFNTFIEVSKLKSENCTYCNETFWRDHIKWHLKYLLFAFEYKWLNENINAENYTLLLFYNNIIYLLLISEWEILQQKCFITHICNKCFYFYFL